jgi:hypothetical protein
MNLLILVFYLKSVRPLQAGLTSIFIPTPSRPPLAAARSGSLQLGAARQRRGAVLPARAGLLPPLAACF